LIFITFGSHQTGPAKSPREHPKERLGEDNLFRLFFNRGAADQAAHAG
jgi:hypothetical protein